jgi:hypothetical protein
MHQKHPPASVAVSVLAAASAITGIIRKSNEPVNEARDKISIFNIKYLQKAQKLKSRQKL